MRLIVGIVIENTGDRISSMGSFWATLFVEDFFGVAVVRGNEEHATGIINGVSETCELDIDGL